MCPGSRPSLAPLRKGSLDPKQRARLHAELRLIRAVRPETPLPEEVWRPLVSAIQDPSHPDYEVGVWLLTLAPDNFEVQRAVGFGAVTQGSEDYRRELIKGARRALELAPEGEREEIAVSLVKGLNLQSRRKEALEAGREVLPECTSALARMEVYMHMAIAAIALEEWETALRTIDLGLGVNPEFLKFHFYRAKTLVALGRPEEAYVDALKFSKSGVEPGTQNHLWSCAWAWNVGYPQGKLAELKAGVESYLRKSAVHPGWWVRGAYLQLSAGELAEAQRSLASSARAFQDQEDRKLRKLTQRARALRAAVAERGAEALPDVKALVDELERRRKGGLRP